MSDSKSKRNFQKFGLTLKVPKYIIIVSAHYVTKDLKTISPDTNKIMYDFYGFEDELYKVKYEINSDKNLTNNLIEELKKDNINISIDENRKSYDHGVWNVLALLYEKLNIPVLQLSIPISYSATELIQLGEKLKDFKNDAMIICSGGITHNLGDMSYNLIPKNYAKEFNDKIKYIIENGNEKDLININKDVNFYKNHPSSEHFLPLFIAFGSAINKNGKSFNSEILYTNISMESFIFDESK
ncbi:DODA-type extradiol aromatic ring-opening family dioxygenase [Arcobacter lacus]|uniref:DODA-type extradiol aromatic ring-opening family dioxygenase n=1 Tax=Arcobacter lacus TaxID=1912876 RepID=UPI002244F71B|nr:class III extradiol ring-cleavage dioxygenase [Arcobacter lacus]